MSSKGMTFVRAVCPRATAMRTAPLASQLALGLLLLAWAAFAAGGCSSSDETPATSAPDTSESSPDTQTGTSDSSTTSSSSSSVSSTRPTSRSRESSSTPSAPTDFDLTPYLEGGDPDQSARAYVTVEESELIGGEGSEGLVGDLIIENDLVRFMVGFGDRAIGPCSWDGNIIGAERRDLPDWERQGNVLGEICLLMNVGLTFYPESADVLHAGGQGEAAVIAVTGRTEILDFLNLTEMVQDYLPELADNFPVDPERLLPVTITIYYVLRPGDPGVRVFSTLRNDSDEIEYVVLTHLLLSGTTGAFFNPLGSLGGWGFQGLGTDNLNSPPVPFIAYGAEHSSYAYVPRPDPELRGTLPTGGAKIGVSGVMASTFATDSLLNLILTRPRDISRNRGFQPIPPGETIHVEHWVLAGDGRLSTVVDSAMNIIGLETLTLTGRVLDSGGAPVAGAVITPIDDRNRAWNQTRSDEDGRWSLQVPRRAITLRARGAATFVDSEELSLADEEGVFETADMVLPDPARVTIEVKDADGDPTPARITVLCRGACTNKPDTRERDPAMLPPGGWERIVTAGMDGVASFDLGEGSYEIFVSRGMTWSRWPTDTPGADGHLLDVVAGDTVTLEAEIHPVIDTSGTLSADFHIHAMASPDSNVANRLRVLDFLSEGLEVMVSSDHDAVTDFAPTITALGADPQITSLVGNEITTPNIGHFNAFPLLRDENARRGGPLDWSGGLDPNLTPQQLYDAIREHPGEQVIQVNHPAGTGTIGVLRADVLTGQTFADREAIRMPHADPDPVTGDTGLWSDEFTAIEIMNGHGTANFWSSFRWWLTMVGRGFIPAGTAVTDTHSLYGSLGASPRSFVFVDEGKDTPPDMDVDHFVRMVNEARLIGTNGPFFRARIETDGGEIAHIGDTLFSDGETVTAYVDIQTPEWMRVDTVDVYLNVDEDLIGEPGEALTTRLAPSFSVPVDWDSETDLQVVAEGERAHRAWRRTVTIPIETEVDAWVVFMVRSEAATDMFPVLNRTNVRPMAWSNPILIDADGGGYDNPPLADLRATQAALPREIRVHHVTDRSAEERPLTQEDVVRMLERLLCDHDGAHMVHESIDGEGAPHVQPGRRHHHHGGDHHHGHHHHGHHHHAPADCAQ